MALIYVDDKIFTGSSLATLDDLIKAFSSDFPIKDLGNLNFFLGVEVSWSTTGMHLYQQRYITNLLHRTNMQSAKPITSPMLASASLSKFDGSLLVRVQAGRLLTANQITT